MHNRVHERIYGDRGLYVDTVTIINKYNRGKNNSDIESCAIGEKLYWPFGTYQKALDLRFSQMEKGTPIELHLLGLNGDRKTPKDTSTHMIFRINEINPGWMPNIPKYYNGYIAILQRIN